MFTWHGECVLHRVIDYQKFHETGLTQIRHSRMQVNCKKLSFLSEFSVYMRVVKKRSFTPGVSIWAYGHSDQHLFCWMI